MDHALLSDMFRLGLPITEKILRPIVVYVFLVVGLRLAGKREMAQLNPLDIVVLLTMSNTVQNAIIGDDTSVTGGLIGAATLLGANYFLARLLFSHQRLGRMIEGRPTVLIEGGQLRQDRLARELLTETDLHIAAHKQGFGDLAEIDRAELDPGGTISFTARRPTPEECRYREVMSAIDELKRDTLAVKAALAR